MIDSANYRMADRLAGGDLPAILTERRVERKQSFNQIARALFAEFGIEVTGQTVSNWCDILEIEKPALADASTDAKAVGE